MFLFKFGSFLIPILEDDDTAKSLQVFTQV